MTPHSVLQYEQRLQSLLPVLRAEANNCAMNMQHVYSGYLAVRGAGLVELAIREVMAQYAAQRGNLEIRNFVRHHVKRENSLNCEKIEKLLNRFSSTWWGVICTSATAAEFSAVDSLKTLRDEIAHGGVNGTGFTTVEGYYTNAKTFIRRVDSVVLP